MQIFWCSIQSTIEDHSLITAVPYKHITKLALLFTRKYIS